MKRRWMLAGIVAVATTCHRPLPMPDPVSPVAPAEGEVVRTGAVAMVWTHVSATGFELQLAANSRFSPIQLDTVLAERSVVAAVPTDGAYFWRVRPQSEDGVWGEWSSARRFRLERFRVVTTVRTQGYPHDIALSGTRAYVADGEAGLAVFDVSSIESPVRLGGKMDSLNEAWGVTVRDSLAYVAYGYKELLIANVARPESITVVGVLEYPQPAYGYDVALADSFVYIAADAQFIRVNVSDPRYPNLVYQGYYPRDCSGVAVLGDYAFVALGQLGLASWRLDTAPPVQVGSMDTPGKARGLAVAGGLCGVADGLNGLVIADVSDPQHITPVGALGLSGYANAVAIQDTLAFVACGTGGIAVVNIARPGAPALAATIPSGYAMGVCAAGRYVLAGDRDLGLMVIKQEE